MGRGKKKKKPEKSNNADVLNGLIDSVAKLGDILIDEIKERKKLHNSVVNLLTVAEKNIKMLDSFEAKLSELDKKFKVLMERVNEVKKRTTDVPRYYG